MATGPQAIDDGPPNDGLHWHAWNPRAVPRVTWEMRGGPVYWFGASSDRAPCWSQFRKSDDCNASCHSANTSRAIAMNGPLGAWRMKEQFASHCS